MSRRYPYLVVFDKPLSGWHNAELITEMRTWIHSTCGGHKQAYTLYMPYGQGALVGFRFATEEQAVLFKLTWW